MTLLQTFRPARGVLALATVLVLAFAILQAGPPAARADTAPANGDDPTVSADSLPTVQVNGTVWDQVIVGSTVYVTGSFSKARPAGKPAGTQEQTRSNALAYDLATGTLLPWAPSLNAQGLVITSSDGQIFIGGDFTKVSGLTRNRVVALNPSSGAVVGSFAPSVNGRVKGLGVSGGQVYLGGNFTSVNSQARTRLAAVSTSNGALLGTFKPSADREVQDLTVPNAGNVVAAGGFTKLAGATALGMGSVGAVNGESRSWQINQVIQNYGADSAILRLANDGGQVYGVGYDFGGPSKFEGSFAAKASDGSVVWINSCRGDTYDVAPVGKVLYSVGHAHNCSPIGGNPEIKPRSYQRGLATTTFADGTNKGGFFPGKPKPRLLHWDPNITSRAWTITGNDSYVVVGGTFPSINGTKQQALGRFAIRSKAPNKMGPEGKDTLKPTLQLQSGNVKLTWTAAYDRDNRNLSYEVLRGSTVVTPSPVKVDSAWWKRPTVTWTHTSAPKGSATYSIRVKDALGNTVTGATTSITVN